MTRCDTLKTTVMSCLRVDPLLRPPSSMVLYALEPLIKSLCIAANAFAAPAASVSPSAATAALVVACDGSSSSDDDRFIEEGCRLCLSGLPVPATQLQRQPLVIKPQFLGIFGRR